MKPPLPDEIAEWFCWRYARRGMVISEFGKTPKKVYCGFCGEWHETEIVLFDFGEGYKNKLMKYREEVVQGRKQEEKWR